MDWVKLRNQVKQKWPIDPYKIYERYGLFYVSKSGYNLLMHYLRDALTPDVEMVQYMVEHGCKVNQVSVNG
jgi:hypothetical protein